MLVFWTAGGFASYTEPWDWAVTALGAAVVSFLIVPYMLERLERLEERTAAPQR